MATVIIPAHNEATVIRRCLDSLVQQAGVDNIVVACNGCSDDTVAVVRSEYPTVTCLDIAIPSKVNALNEAEKHIKSWPVFYIDADTKLSEGAIAIIVAGMQNGKILLAAPQPVIDTSQSSWLVKQYYQTWLSLPYIQEGVVATCSYVISETGHKRFTHFPAVINDDGFVRCQFRSHERSNITGARIYISAPRDVGSLIKIKTRARLGNMELASKQLCTQPEKKAYGRILLNKFLSRNVIAVTVYTMIALVIRLRAKRQFSHLSQYRWEKDQSSR